MFSKDSDKDMYFILLLGNELPYFCTKIESLIAFLIYSV